MKRKLLLLNLVLAALVALLAFHLQQSYQEARGHESKVLSARPKTPVPPAIQPHPRISPVSAAQYNDVAQKMLFSPDRNPVVILDPVVVKEKPVPPFPVARGVIIFGDLPPTVILSQKGSAEQKGYKAGDSVGPFQVKSIDNTDVVFEWDGKEFKKAIADLVDNNAPPPPASDARNAGPGASSPQPVLLSGAPDQTREPQAQNANSTEVNAPGLDLGAGFYACNAGDNTPDGTVMKGLKKVISSNPFGPGGKSCHWETSK